MANKCSGEIRCKDSEANTPLYPVVELVGVWHSIAFICSQKFKIKIMKCIDCGCVLSPEEEDDVRAAQCYGINQRALCEDCHYEWTHMEQAIDDVSDADMGL